MTKTYHIKAGTSCRMRGVNEAAPKDWTTRLDLIFQESELIIAPTTGASPLFDDYTFGRKGFFLMIKPEFVSVVKTREGNPVPSQPEEAPKPKPQGTAPAPSPASTLIPAAMVKELHQAVKQLAGVCDGARTLDNCGFSKIDTEFGHALAEAPALSQKQAAWAAFFVIKYQRQLDSDLVERARPFAIVRKKKVAA